MRGDTKKKILTRKQALERILELVEWSQEYNSMLLQLVEIGTLMEGSIFAYGIEHWYWYNKVRKVLDNKNPLDSFSKWQWNYMVEKTLEDSIRLGDLVMFWKYKLENKNENNGNQTN